MSSWVWHVTLNSNLCNFVTSHKLIKSPLFMALSPKIKKKKPQNRNLLAPCLIKSRGFTSLKMKCSYKETFTL